MSTTSNTRPAVLRLLALMAAVGMIFALTPASTASAASPVAGVVEGHASLPSTIGACGASGSFTGTFTGVHGTSAAVLSGASATFTYCNTNTVQGTASGTITLDGHTCGFNWTRVGVTAVIFFNGANCTGGGAAVFVPDADQRGATIVGAGGAV